MRFILVALVFCLIGFLGFYFAFRTGQKSATVEQPQKRSGLWGAFKKQAEQKAENATLPPLIQQLNEFENLLINEDYRKARRMLPKIEDLTPRYKSEWDRVLETRDEHELRKIRSVIKDLRVLMQQGA